MSRSWTYQQDDYFLLADFGDGNDFTVEQVAHQQENGDVIIDRITHIGKAADWNDEKIEEYKRLKMEGEINNE